MGTDGDYRFQWPAKNGARKTMNIKLRRLVRTPSSEQYALFDLDQTDANYDPLSIGKLDLHFSDDGVYGTFLLWETGTVGLPEDQVHRVVRATVQELCEPMGVPSFYAIEFFSPNLRTYCLHTFEDAQSFSDEGKQQHNTSQA
jgi:hypothetical protein